MKYIYIVLIFLAFGVRLKATLGFQVQNIEAKDVGLNGSAMMSSRGIEGIFYNPAVVNVIEKSQILLNYSMVSSDLKYFLVAGKYKNFSLSGNALAFYLRGLYSDNFGCVTSGYYVKSYFSVAEYQGGINYSISKLRKVLFGININFGYEDYFIYNNKYLSIDSGVVIKVSKFIEIVWVGKNIEIYSINSDLAVIHSIGLSYALKIGRNNIKVFPVLKILNNYIEKVIGIEYNYNDIFQIYTGIKFNKYLSSDILNHISFGVSTGYKFIKISYGFKPIGAIGDMHSFSMSYTF